MTQSSMTGIVAGHAPDAWTPVGDCIPVADSTFVDLSDGHEPLAIQGAVLEQSAASKPYSLSRPIRIMSLDLERPRPGEVLVRIEAAGVCHSDLSVVDGSRPRALPVVLGHEAAGIVEELGTGVPNLRVGQRVVLTFLPRCGECPECLTQGKLPCVRGSRSNADGVLLSGQSRLSLLGSVVSHHLGVSAFATHAVVDHRSVVPVGDDVPPAVAALLGCAVLTGGGALLNVGKISEQSSVAIVGLGGVGTAGLLAAVATGCRKIVAIDNHESKLQLALDLGAHAAHTPEQALRAGLALDVVLEAVGHPRAFETAHQVLAAGGTLVTVGLPAPGVLAAIEPLRLTVGAQTIVGSYLGSSVPSRDIPIFEDLWRRGRLPLEKLVSHTIRLDELNEAMDALATGTVLRQIIAFGDKEDRGTAQ